MFIDKRLKTAIFSGKDKLTKRLEREQKVLEKWTRKFIFSAIEKAVVEKRSELEIHSGSLPYHYGFDNRHNFTMGNREKIDVVKRCLEKISGLNVCLATNHYGISYDTVKVSWNLMVDDQLRPVPSPAV